MKIQRGETADIGRGRPRGQRRSMAETTKLLYLVKVSRKYGLETNEFLSCFHDAWAHNKSSCKEVLIQCRQKTDTEGVFLVTKSEKIIAQIILSKEFLDNMPHIDVADYPSSESSTVKKTTKVGPIDIEIKDIDLDVKWINLKAKVIEKTTPKGVYSRYGNPLSVSIATISDDTGTIKLPLWNAQINSIRVGDTVRIENGRVRSFRGELQVSVGTKGKLEVIEK
ncbi:OB-fold nucleic acid binding domain-containing protein [[Eubacterium] cellulosolvens]